MVLQKSALASTPSRRVGEVADGIYRELGEVLRGRISPSALEGWITQLYAVEPLVPIMGTVATTSPSRLRNASIDLSRRMVVWEKTAARRLYRIRRALELVRGTTEPREVQIIRLRLLAQRVAIDCSRVDAAAVRSLKRTPSAQ